MTVKSENVAKNIDRNQKYILDTNDEFSDERLSAASNAKEILLGLHLLDLFETIQQELQ